MNQNQIKQNHCLKSKKERTIENFLVEKKLEETLASLEFYLEYANCNISFIEYQLYPDIFRKIYQKYHPETMLSPEEKDKLQQRRMELKELEKRCKAIFVWWSYKKFLYEFNYETIVTPMSKEDAFLPKEIRKSKQEVKK